MKKYKELAAFLIVIISIFIILFFKQIPTGKLWKNYSVLYFPVDTPVMTVEKTLQGNGIDNYICLENQYVPMKISDKSPEYSMLLLNSSLSETESDFSYLFKRNLYFFDKENTVKIYYIPAEFQKSLPKIVKKLNSQNIEANVDAQVSYPWILPCVCFILFIAFLLFSKNKILFFITSLIPQLVVLCNPFYPVALSCCLFLLVLFFISNLWERNGMFLFLLNEYYVPAIIVVSIICCFASSVKTGLICVVSYAGICGMYNSYSAVKKIIQSKNIFTAVKIIPAKYISIFSGKRSFVMMSVTAAMVIILATLLLSNTIIGESVNNNQVLLPSANGNAKLFNEKNENAEEKNLPKLEDYYRWTWNVKTFPYKSINNKENDDIVSFYDYEEKDGVILQNTKTFVYDDNYKNSVYNEIDNLNFNSVETLLKSQNNIDNAGYSASGISSVNLFCLAMCIICFIILLFIYFSIIIKKGVKK